MIPMGAVHVARRPDNPYNVKETVKKLKADIMKVHNNEQNRPVSECEVISGHDVEVVENTNVEREPVTNINVIDEDYDDNDNDVDEGDRKSMATSVTNTPVATITSKDCSLCR